MQANNSLVLRLGKEVAELVLAAQNSSDAAALRTAQAIRNGRLLLLLITALSVVGAVVIAVLYVVPRVVRPIERITAAMSGLAAGDTSIDVPGRDRSDEIGRMAEALGVFRDTAIEVQRSNQREIREGRRRLAVAIESISEAFSLYDARIAWWCATTSIERSFIRATRVEISPGMTFESIVRRAAERGYVKDAEGRVEEWVRERMARHREPSGPQVQQRGDGRWILVSERKTDDGGTVAVYSDITELKQRENQLAEKSKALEQLSSQLAKYLSPQVYESIFTGKQEVKIASRRKKLTVFFSDIAGFTETTDQAGVRGPDPAAEPLSDRDVADRPFLWSDHRQVRRRRHRHLLRRSGDTRRQGGCPRLRRDGHRHAEEDASSCRTCGGRRASKSPSSAGSGSTRGTALSGTSAARIGWTTPSSAAA